MMLNLILHREILHNATQLYDAILEIDPNYSDAIAGKGAIHHRMGDFSTAIEYYDIAIAINATNPFFS